MKNVVPNENCLTEVQLLRYLHDECSADEVRAIDRHLTHCPMCSDALEGAMLLNTARLERSLKHLDTKITTQFSDKTPFIEAEKPVMTVVKSPKRRGWLLAAASIAALFGLGIWILTKPFEADFSSSVAATDTVPNYQVPPQASTETNMAQAESSKKDSKTSDESIVNESKNANLSENNTGTQPSSKEIEANDDVAVVQDKQNNAIVNTPQADFGTTSAKKPVATRPAVTTNQPETEGVALSAKDALEQQRKKTEESALKEVVVADSYKKASNAKEKARSSQPTATPSSVNNYPGAAAQNAVTETQSLAKAKQSTDNGLADYQIGMQYYTKGQYKEAIGQLNRVLAKQSQGDVYENALWYLANSYLKMNKTIEAKGILKRIVAEKGKYAQQAAALLK